MNGRTYVVIKANKCTVSEIFCISIYCVPVVSHRVYRLYDDIVLQARYGVFPVPVIIMLSIVLSLAIIDSSIHSQHTGASAQCAVPYPCLHELFNTLFSDLQEKKSIASLLFFDICVCVCVKISSCTAS